MTQNYATIDIGTNTILMLIAKKNNISNFLPILDEHRIARLGEGLHKTGLINDDAIKRAANILAEYKKKMDEFSVEKVFIVGTSAFRDAKNSAEVIKKLEKIIKNKINIISGDEEANLSYLGAINNHDDYVTVIDIGGGSTEIITGRKNEILNHISFQMGAVRMTEIYLKNDPPNENEIFQMEEKIQNILNTYSHINDFSGLKVYAVAGTPTTLAAIDLQLKDFEYDKIENHELKLDKIIPIFNKMKLMTVDEIINRFYVNPKRADVIIAGTCILIQTLKKIQINSCFVTTKGIRFGMMKKLINNIL